MDSISQAALGASIGEVLLGRRIGNKAGLLGAAVATIPDMDVILLPFFDSYQRISIHRGFSHSILFSLLLATILMLLFKRLSLTAAISRPRIWLFSWLALLTHMLLDAFTPYGTQLLLPFSNLRVSFDCVTVVDPVYTLPLLAAWIGGWLVYRNLPDKRRILHVAGLIVSTGYLVFALFHKTSIDQRFEAAFTDRGVEVDEMLVVPVQAANLKWSGVAMTADTFYIGTYSSVARDPIELLAIPHHPELLNNLDENLVKKMKWFAKDHYAVLGTADAIRFYNMQVDMQGARQVNESWVPTAWYYYIQPREDGSYLLESRLHE